MRRGACVQVKKHRGYANLFVVEHPLILHKLTLMREKSCPPGLFRALLREITLLMGFEATRPLPLAVREIDTPIARAEGFELAENEPVIVPILRAGLTMADGMLELLPAARVGHIGLYRDPRTKMPVEYLVNLPDPAGRHFFVVDPMLATGHSAIHAFRCLERAGVSREDCTLVSLVGAPEGVAAFECEYPEVPVFLAALDARLDDHAYIVPGLGDAGDRLFGTH